MKKDDRARFTLRIPQNLFCELGKRATALGTPINALILHILWEWLKDSRAAKDTGE